MSSFLAFDFGASSGRAILATVKNKENKDEKEITLEEIHRFSNEPVFLGEKYVWDFPSLLNETKKALKKASLLNCEIKAIGIDTWGVDYGLLDKEDNLIGIPMHYRDKGNYEAVEKVKEIMDLKNLYLETGISNNVFNTAFQLVRDSIKRKIVLENSDTLLFMPDLFAYYLTGAKKNEFTIASTSGLLDIKKRNWNFELIEKLGIKKEIFNKIIEPGEVYGYLTEDIIEETGLDRIPVIAVGGHDTASAVAGTPFINKNNAFLSSGTWSLLGLELDESVINDESYEFNLTNEGGVGNKIRLLKNINGTWLIQQLKKSWGENYGEIGFQDIIREANKHKEAKYELNTNNQELMNTKDMIKSIKKYCVTSGQGEPKELGELAIAIYNGLTIEYKDTIEELERVTGKEIAGINIVGGGIQDQFLCEMTSKVTGKTVITGPIEAAVLGNVVLQAIWTKEIENIEEGRKIIRNSFGCKGY